MIYLIFTTCILNRQGLVNDEHRKKTYLNSIRQTLSVLPQGIKPIIVENNGKRETYLDEIGIDVLYTDNNSVSTYHKGVNELMDIHSVIQHYNIQDDDIIIKITGRYHANKSDFFQFVIDHQHEYDSFVKYYNVCTYTFMRDDCVLGLFAMRCQHLKAFMLKGTYSSPEVEFAVYARHIGKTYEVETLHVTCCFAEDFRMLDV